MAATDFHLRFGLISRLSRECNQKAFSMPSTFCVAPMGRTTKLFNSSSLPSFPSVKNSFVHYLYHRADQLSHSAIGAAIEVHRLKGPGLIESIYERCLMRELEPRQLMGHRTEK